jgi:serine/threonine protein kinase
MVKTSKHVYEMFTMTGHELFRAPELQNGGKYTESIDLWSVGLVVFFTLKGYHPFFDENLPAMLKKIETCHINYSEFNIS